MGEPAFPSPADIAQTFALARALVAAVENDEDIMHELQHVFGVGDPEAERAIYALAQLLVLVADGAEKVAQAIELLESSGRLIGKARESRLLGAVPAVLRTWFDERGAALRAVASAARKEPS